ncbi:hypothetical protein Calkr_0999 [Caldicellulosiruptor acetigenus I77R1B]|uniref:DUF4363 domain-containing protein n=1 Tax=Caldicellulosiruptor acetigenus (strain ATCC 700853 / DSM 12137 / I77R1B) TaxID=632335 RepID=E4S559_CALA7|nr:DUF4363 family protein [Caldicellulosiruptor acetigenus]ADQ40513.1 hypothetical protein Calkr_0999 [Caldicellulosiruptor acetigenus I77R1B]
MKVWATVVGFLILVIVLMLISTHIILGAADKIESELSGLYENVIKNDYKLANSNYLDIVKKWGEYKKGWAMLIEHQEIDKIDEELTKIKEYLLEQDRTLLLSEISLLKFYIRHVREMILLKIENIF